jgi:hypothetical protein
MSIATFIKDPDAVLDYTGDWSAWLGDDTIVSSTWDIPSGITLDSDTNDATTVTIWLSGGTAGTKYQLTNHIVTTGGRADDRTIAISVKEK